MKEEELEKYDENLFVPRRRAASEIKLLRLELIPKGKTPCEEIGSEWSSAQPAENLSPSKAAACLGVEIWAPQSIVKKRYKTLQLRYPPDQFVEKHSDWRPSAELLGNPRSRLNWFWQSGFVPLPESMNEFKSGSIWDKENAEPMLHSHLALKRVLSDYLK
ncbi:hypothetical protein QEJ31_11605 [Pigmentibacter sp. JX0631]|uniref:hypothetical protein n=1 Tax=Pigmentibacter sp. JX0631 TaxID=2976982 RepID=UPI0024699849|nr:hypothetical protein [Pigmentibacter sp. JX0631]WGL59167.1 hypothetical protein QEJ31_11605 [Pigmentibacter sp. JX0631]